MQPAPAQRGPDPLSVVILRKKFRRRSKRPGFGGGDCLPWDAAGAAGAGGVAGAAACSGSGAGAGFTRPRNSYKGRSRTSRTSMIVSGEGAGGGSGEFALKLSAGIRTVYTGSLPEAAGGATLSVFLRGGATGDASGPMSTGGSPREAEAGAAGVGALRWARG